MILSGILLTPTGVPYSNSLVRITANNTSPDVLMFVTKDFKTDTDGEYEIDVPNGWYKVSVFVNDYHAFTSIGNIEITDDTTETTINALLMIGQTAGSDPLVAQVAANAASALASKNAAAVSATNAANSATASQTSASNSATSATSSATSATTSSSSAATATIKAAEAVVSAQSASDSAMAAQAASDETPNLSKYYQLSDGSDWAPAFQRAVAAGKLRVKVKSGNYGVGSTVFLPAGFWIDGESRNTTFFPLVTATSLTNGFLFMINSNDGVSWITPYPNMNTGGFTSCQFDNRHSIPALRGVKCFGSGKFEQLSFSGYRQSISRPTGFYCDSFQVKDIICQNPQDNTEYQIDIQGLGDGFTAHDIHCPYTVATTSSVLAMRVRGVNGGTISDCIGGDYLIELSNDVNITSGHFERAQHIYDSANVRVSSQFNPDVRIPIITKGTFASANNESRFVVDLSNTTFRNIEGLMEWTGFHVSQGSSVQLSIENTSQVWSVQGDFQRVQKAGIRICQEDLTTTVPSFNNYSYLTSKRSFVDIPNIVSLNHSTRMSDTGFVGISTTRVEPVGVRSAGVNQWKISTGTYYYNAQILYDTGRALGRNPTNSEVSATAALGSMIINNIGFGTAPRNAIIRLYRGTSTNSYSHFVDIHTIGSTWLHDNGNSVNGIAWSTRTAGPMNTINSVGSYIKFNGSLIDLTATTIPNSAGSFTQGDRVTKPDSALDANSMLLIGYQRLTTGSGGVVGTDWANLRVSHVSPSV